MLFAMLFACCRMFLCMCLLGCLACFAMLLLLGRSCACVHACPLEGRVHVCMCVPWKVECEFLHFFKVYGARHRPASPPSSLRPPPLPHTPFRVAIHRVIVSPSSATVIRLYCHTPQHGPNNRNAIIGFQNQSPALRLYTVIRLYCPHTVAHNRAASPSSPPGCGVGKRGGRPAESEGAPPTHRPWRRPAESEGGQLRVKAAS